MDLRSAATNKKIQNLHKTPAYLREAIFAVKGDHPQKIEFASALSVISGRNGAGKTTVLKSIAVALGVYEGPDSSTGRPHPFLQSCAVSGGGENDPWRADYNFFEGQHSGRSGVEAYYLDPAKEVLRGLLLMERDPNFNDLLESVGSRDFDSDMLEATSYVIGRDYSKITVYEIDSMAEDEVAIPFFEVRTRDSIYNSVTMGRGELNLIYIIWFLWYVGRGAVLLIEEPEAHLAQFSQNRLLTAFAAIRDQRNLQLVLSSHYPGFFQTLDPGAVHSVDFAPKLELRKVQDINVYCNRLGASVHIENLLLVEDSLGKALLNELIKTLDPGLTYNVVSFIVNTGESGIFSFIKAISGQGGNYFNIIGIVDGDCRTKVSYSEAGLLFLPGDKAPEQLTKDLLLGCPVGPEREALGLDVDSDELQLILNDAEGLEIHDWFQCVARKVGGQQLLLRAAVKRMLLTEDLSKQADELVSMIRERSS